MKTEIIKPEPEFRPVVLQITLESPDDVEIFKQVGFSVFDLESNENHELVNKLRAMRDSL